jgi:isopentenyl diphosphate isomerase/L-lactate dehydrogenase-like FMN-dependent dehydrogenase
MWSKWNCCQVYSHTIDSTNFSLLLFSNHGGRQIDTIVPAIECLEDIINVVDGRAEGIGFT